MRDVWDRIEAWLAENAREVLTGLRPGAGEAAVRAAEGEFGVRFPEDVRESYRRHDGAVGPELLGYWRFLSLEEMVAAWKGLKGSYDKGYFRESGGPRCKDLAGVGYPVGPVRPQYWNPKWVPFTDSEGHHLCFDLDPAKGGRAGQVLMFDRALAERVVLGASFGAWWGRLAEDLEGGRRVRDERGVLVQSKDF